MAQVLPYPWSLLAPPGDKGMSLSLEHCERAEPLNGESLTFFEVADEQAFAIRHAVRFAEGVKFNPKTEAGRVRGAKGEVEWMQNGRFRMGSSSCGFSSEDSLKNLLPSSPL